MTVSAGRRSRLLLFAALFGLVLVSVAAGPALGGESAGLRVVLGPCGTYKAAKLDAAVDLLERRVWNLGLDGASVSRRGSEIVVRLPGVVDRHVARFLLLDELRLRPVLMAGLPAERDSPRVTQSVPTTGPPTTTADVRPDTSTAGRGRADIGRTNQGATDPAVAAVRVVRRKRGRDAADDSHHRTRRRSAHRMCRASRAGGKSAPRYYLGPAELTASSVDRAVPQFSAGQGWTVKVDLTDSGSSKLDAFARRQFHKPIAITLVGVVRSAPVVQPDARSFRSFGGTIQISGDFSGREAEDLAHLINFGAAPAFLRVKQATVTSHL